MTVLWRTLHFVLCFLSCVIHVEEVETIYVTYSVRILYYNATLDPEYGNASAYIVDKAINLDVNLVKDIYSPSFHLMTIERNRNQKKTWINATFKSCELRKQIKGNPAIFLAQEMIRKYANFTINCHYSPGFYYLRDYRPGTSSSPLTFVYRTNSQVITNLTLFDGNRSNPFGNVLSIVKIIRS